MKIQEVLKAQQELNGVIRVTPLVASALHPELYFKTENLQLTGSFKIRAAFSQIAQLGVSERKRGIVTSSSGNFAQAVAYVSKLQGVSATVVMAESSQPLKVGRTRQMGATVVFCEDRFEAREGKVAEIRESQGRSAIHPYDNASGVAGNGTVALEILQQLPEVENIVVPVSGGGLIGGVAFVAKTKKPSLRVWGIQPRGSNAAHLSFQAKKIRSIDTAQTMADGLRVTQPGDFTFPLIREYVDAMEIVEEESILGAVAHLLNEERLVVEPSGAVPLAAVLEGKIPLSRTVLVLSGGNIDPKLLRQASHKTGKSPDRVVDPLP